MFIQLVFLTIALSIDSLGIGISYGIRKISFHKTSIFIISLISLTFSSISIYFGKLVTGIFSEKTTTFISIFILFFIGLWVILQTYKNDKSCEIYKKQNFKEKTIFSVFIKSLGISINIIKCPEICDIDNSSKIEPKEAIYLGFALSIDSIGAGIAISSINTYSFMFPILIMLSQLTLLYLGVILGKKIKFKKLNENVCSIFSGVILMTIALLRLFFN